MDLTSDVFTSILSPLAAFLPPNGPTPEPATSITTTTDTATAESHTTTTTSGTTITTTPSDTTTATTTPNPKSNPTPTTPWQTSPLNPQSRIDSLAPFAPLPPSSSTSTQTAANATWRLDTVDPTGRRFFATPRFALGKPPLRIDVYLPPVEDFPPALREVVRPEQAIYHRRGGRVSELPVGRYLLRVLQRWEEQQQREADAKRDGNGGGGGGLEEKWWSLPFGSCISVDVAGLGMGMAMRREEVVIAPGYGVEQGMLDLGALQRMWEGEVAWEGVEVVEWERLRFGRQVHEVISLVGVDGGLAVGGDREVVFKCVLEEQRYMYNELKMLLLLGAHPNVISRPLGVVTKKGRFGNRRGVCGFLLEWFPLGSLREKLLRDDYEETTSMAQRLRWARQVTEAFVHVNGHKAGFYPDLKPDNIVLREDAETGMLDAVLIDLEQRGGWYAWSPPEVAYMEYLEIMADDSGLPEGDLKDEIIDQLGEYYGDPGWSPGGGQRYHNVEGGFSSPWLALLKEREAKGKGMDLLERAQVFMLGKLLWCIFEGQPLVRCGIDHEVLRDADPEYESKRSGKVRAFPEFKRTPDVLRQLIRACTAGAPEWDVNHPRLPGVVLRGGQLYPADSGCQLDTATAEDTLAAARGFWRREVELARAFLEASILLRGKSSEGGPEHAFQFSTAHDLLAQVRKRPLFAEVLSQLERIESRLGGGSQL